MEKCNGKSLDLFFLNENTKIKPENLMGRFGFQNVNFKT